MPTARHVRYVILLNYFLRHLELPTFILQFVGCLIIIILLELSVGIAAASLRPQLEGTLKTQLRASFIKNKSTKEEDSTYREFWDRIQTSVSFSSVTAFKYV